MIKYSRKYYVTIAGGLGNQMLSYSLWYYLCKQKVKAELSSIHNGLLDHNGLEINHVFSNTKSIGDEKKIIRRYRKIFSFINRCVNFVIKVLGLHWRFDIFQKSFSSIIMFPRYKTYTFFPHIANELHSIFEFPKDSDFRNISIIREMKECQSVSIHVRRGDYQSKITWRILLGDICEKQYYSDAIDYIKQKFTTPKFYIFSDDIDWVKQNLEFDDATYINWNKGDNSFRDMQLMSYCKANIIANSTFSLMAAWLNVHDDCIRIAPSKWTNTAYNLCDKYVPSDWIVIDNSQPFVSIVIGENVTNPERIINSMYKQTISDYEIILPLKLSCISSNNRQVKINAKPIGHHVISITHDGMWKRRDRYCLQNLLIEKLKK